MTDTNKKALLVGTIAVLVLAGLFFLQKPQETTQTKNSDTLMNDEQKYDVSSGEVEYAAGIKGYFARPEVSSAYPGIVMIHEWWGLNDNIKDMAQKLAGEGYMVLAVDLFKGSVATTAEQARAQVGALNQEEATANLKAAASYLRSRQATRVASLGWCFGGGQSMQLAISGENVAATVIYYGNLVTEQEKLAAIRWPVLGVFGDADQSIPVSTVQAFDQTLDNLGIENEIYIYPGVGHAFANPSGANYAPEETQDAWQKTLEFLSKHLREA
jgi:carboxymethylenebutenolidase